MLQLLNQHLLYSNFLYLILGHMCYVVISFVEIFSVDGHLKV